jgi:stringent starvation protein B
VTEKHSLPEKKELVEALMTKGTVLLHLDPRKEGVVVPAWLIDQPQLVLQIGYYMPIPIPDLRIDELGVSATLSFNRSAYPCFIPWKAIFAVVGDDGKGTSWPDDLPAEIVAEIEREIRRVQIRKAPELEKAESKSVSEASDPRSKIGHLKKRPGRKLVKARPVPSASYEDSERTSTPQSAIMPQRAPSERVQAPTAPSANAAPRPSLTTVGRPALKGKARTLPPYLRVIK